GSNGFYESSLVKATLIHEIMCYSMNSLDIVRLSCLLSRGKVKGLIKLICNPPEIETYRIVQTGVKPETDRDTIAIDGVTFYDFNEQTDLFDGFYALPIN
ncbi:hypothetical protein M7775_09110, partial [Sporomusa sphaeroides DSM 2875]|uniref:hypothetical protein n=1 Tax=Sporomusa sphaeroides TaxID=47679 RepID=UPI0020309650